MNSFFIDKCKVGDGEPPIILPDIGTFFNKDVSLAKKMLAACKDAGIKIVKGEILHDPEICLNDDTVEKFQSVGGECVERYRDLIERKCLSLEEYRAIFETAKDLEMPFVLSVYDIAGANFAREMGACALKIATSNLVHGPLIRHVASLGLPVLIDTGKASMSEIARAVEWLRDCGMEQFIVEHSPAKPPAPLEDHNLRNMITFQRAFNCPVGLSDHHHGEEMMYAASALGVAVIEKGICPDGDAVDQDVYHALPIDQLSVVVQKCENIHAALGDFHRNKQSTTRAHNRMGLVARVDLEEHEVLSIENVSFAFPTKGIPVEDFERIEGLEVLKALKKGDIIEWQHVRFQSA